ncbi:unnamed protein product [Arabidopsis thaliana]|uniref:Uncharacterized protein n=1 Tax=Arabidopsis thaliana TaxID=3702 RepID=Q9LW79_ARATH|nr:unnamed protein product [Arabidopsis thaliana]
MQALDSLHALISINQHGILTETGAMLSKLPVEQKLESNYSENWCKRNNMKYYQMKLVRDMKRRLKETLEKLQIKIYFKRNDMDVVKKSIISWFFLNSTTLERDGFYKTRKHVRIEVDPTSVLNEVSS